MAVQKYKLVIMGASGVGKTVFLGSYFYATIQRGMRKKHIISLQKEAIKPAQDLMERLFKGALGGTDKRVDMSFNVDNSMAIQLSDLPGGYTTDVDQWLAQGVGEDLKTADGVIFFISADDLLHDYYKCVKDVVPFTTAISQYIRINEGGAANERADVPIYFLFTKCDLIKNDKDKDGKPYTAKKLLAMAQGLKAATRVGEKSVFFKKGQRDRAYTTCALGDWLDPNTPPAEADYAPQNVIEPMEDLFEAMQDARSKHSRTKMSLKTGAAIACAVVLFLGLLGVDWGVQHSRWSKAEKASSLATAEKNYPAAIGAYEDYRGKSPILPIIPRFMLPGSDVNERIDKLNDEFEKYSYNKLEGYFGAEDLTKMPDMNNAINQDVTAEIAAYLKNEYFMLNAQEHYKKVKDYEAYYATAGMLSREIKSYDDIQYILEKIDVVPESWRPTVLNRAFSGLGLWGQSVAQEAGLEEEPVAAIELLNKAMDQGRLLIDNPWIIEEESIHTQLEKQIAGWNELASKRWDKLVSLKIASAVGLDNEEAVKTLENAKIEFEGMPDDSREKLDKAIADQYDALVLGWKNAGLSSVEVKEKLASFSEMTPDAKKVAYDYIRQQEGFKLEDLRSRLSTARDLKELNAIWQEATRDLAGTSFSPDELRGTLQGQFVVLVKKKLNEGAIKIEGTLSKNDKFVRGGLKQITDTEAEIGREISVFASICDTDVAKSAVEDWKKELLAKAENAEYLYIKKAFLEIKISDLTSNFDDMKAFINNYPNSQRRGEVEKAINFLEIVRNGRQATVKIERVSVGQDTRWFRSPKLYVVVSGPATAQTQPISGKDIIVNHSFNLNWQISGAPLEFRVYDDKGKEKDLLGEATAICNGIKGWMNLNNRLILKDPKTNTDNGSITISVDVKDLPECPW